MDRWIRPLDFTLILHSRHLPDVEQLRAGAASARQAYPVTASAIDGRRRARMEWDATGASSEDEAEVSSECPSVLQVFVDAPFDLRVHAPVRQVVVTRSGRTSILATRFHHAVADGVSAALWLAHQLRVARGAPAGAPAPPLRLRRRARRPAEPIAVRGRSARLWRRPGRATRARRWLTLEFPRLRAAAPDGTAPFTCDHVLLAAALDGLDEFNSRRGAGGRPVGLWVPIDIRRPGPPGFGNGTSRVRIHRPEWDEMPVAARAHRVRVLLRAAMRSGEWAVPDRHPLTRVPGALMGPILRAYLQRPWADVGTATFSHLDQWTGEPREIFDGVDRIDAVAPLHARHPLSIAGVSDRARTWLTFTYDPGWLTGSDVRELADIWRDRLERAREEAVA